MFSWLTITLIAYFLNAVAAVIDKTMLKKNVLRPMSYTFSIAMLGGLLMIFVIPFGFSVPTLTVTIVALIAGAVFIWALILMFKALGKDDASRISPMIGGLIPVFVFILAWFVLEENLTNNQYLALVFLILGTLIIALDFKEYGFIHWLKKKIGRASIIHLPKIRKTFWLALPASILFAVSHVLTKFIYSNTDFLSGFVWTRLGSFLAVLGLLLIPLNRKIIKQDLKNNKKQPHQTKTTTIRFLIGQAAGGGGAILLQYAIFLGSVTMVNALQGIQYAFVFILVTIFSLLLPKLLKEKFNREIIIQKIVAILLIAIGLYFIAI